MNVHPEIVPSLVDRIKQTLVALKRPRAIEILDFILRRLDHDEMTAIEAIDALLAEELTLREDRRVKMALMMARLSSIKTLAGFDFSFQPSLDKNRIMALAELEFIDRREIAHFLGPPGTGKSYLSLALGVQAVKAGSTPRAASNTGTVSPAKSTNSFSAAPCVCRMVGEMVLHNRGRGRRIACSRSPQCARPGTPPTATAASRRAASAPCGRGTNRAGGRAGFSSNVGGVNSRRSSSASSNPSGNGQVMPMTAARRRYSPTVDPLTPVVIAICRSLTPSACLNLRTSRTFRIGAPSAGIGPPLTWLQRAPRPRRSPTSRASDRPH